MRKLIAFVLAITMLCCLFGCGKKENESTKHNYSLEDLLLGQATLFAQQMGAAINTKYPELIGITNVATPQVQFFTAAGSTKNISSAAFLPLDGIDLPVMIASLNAEHSSAEQMQSINLLGFSSQFYSPIAFSGNKAVHMVYGKHCHIVVFFEAMENQLVRVTVYPMFPQAGQAMMNQHFSDVNGLSATQIDAAIQRASIANCAATPSGNAAPEASHYLQLANKVLSGVEAVSNEVLDQFTNNSAVLAQAAQFVNALTSEAIAARVYHLPDNLEGVSQDFPSRPVQHLAYQALCLRAFPNQLCTGFGQTSVAANAIAQNVITTRNPGIVSAKNESPVLVALDHGEVTVLVILYPNEYNIYLHTVSFLSCTFDQATDLLARRGATPMQ